MSLSSISKRPPDSRPPPLRSNSPSAFSQSSQVPQAYNQPPTPSKNTALEDNEGNDLEMLGALVGVVTDKIQKKQKGIHSSREEMEKELKKLREQDKAKGKQIDDLNREVKELRLELGKAKKIADKLNSYTALIKKAYQTLQRADTTLDSM